MSLDLVNSLLANLWSIFLIVLFFGGSIFIHELGHFLAARRRGVKVERFSIGFGPKIFSWRGADGVEYRLSWLPLGGYVALPQLADMRTIEGEFETDTSQLPPIDYGTKILVFAAGATMNVVFAFVLATVLWVVGQPTSSELTTTRIGLVMPTVTLPDGASVPSPASQAGLKPGDTIRAIDGRSIQTWTDLQQTLFSSSGRTPDGRPQAKIRIERNGQLLELTVFPRLAGEEGVRIIGIAPLEELFVFEAQPASLAAKSGLQADDQIISVDDQAILHSRSYVELLRAHPDRPVSVGIRRAGQPVTITVPPRAQLKNPADLGVSFKSGFKLIHPNPVRQLAEHVTMTFRVLGGLLNPRSDLGPSKLSGPVGIARMFHATAQADIRLVLWFTILVNVNLAIFNLLPIPVLDGGHMLFATIARLRGRALPVNFIAATQSVFIVLLFGLIIYVSFFDVRRIVRDVRADAQAKEAAAKAAAPAPAPAPAKP
jgi:regulator of sigma E protease